MHAEWDFLSNDTETVQIRYVTLITGRLNRFDLAIVTTTRFYGKKLVMDMMRNVFAIVGPDDLGKPGFLAHAYRLNEEEADELAQYLQEVIGPIHYPE